MTDRDVTGSTLFAPPVKMGNFLHIFWADFLIKLHSKPGEKE